MFMTVCVLNKANAFLLNPAQSSIIHTPGRIHGRRRPTASGPSLARNSLVFLTKLQETGSRTPTTPQVSLALAAPLPESPSLPPLPSRRRRRPLGFRVLPAARDGGAPGGGGGAHGLRAPLQRRRRPPRRRPPVQRAPLLVRAPPFPFPPPLPEPAPAHSPEPGPRPLVA